MNGHQSQTGTNASMDKMYLSIVVPAYNEEKKIAKDIALLYAYLNKKSFSYEVVVVDDGSEDQTANIVDGLKQSYANLRCVRYEKNRGKGFAVKTGVLQARGEYIIFIDAGSCIPISFIDEGLKLLQECCDIAIASRALPDSVLTKKPPIYRLIGAKIFYTIILFLMGIKNIADTQCGLKLFKREAALKIFGKNKIDGFMFDAETLINAKKMGFVIQEFPVTWHNDADSRLKPVTGSFRIFWELFLIKISR